MTTHPCFDGHQHTRAIGRAHLPLVAACNIKCSYCSRKSSCAHENRPGISERVLSVEEALDRVAQLEQTNLKIIGLSGPGDPMAQPEKVFGFVRELRNRYGEHHEICISTNGLVLHRYIDELKALKVNYVTLTMNAVDADVLAQLVEWVSDEGVVHRAREASEVLIDAQRRSLEGVVAAGIRCK